MPTLGSIFLLTIFWVMSPAGLQARPDFVDATNPNCFYCHTYSPASGGLTVEQINAMVVTGTANYSVTIHSGDPITVQFRETGLDSTHTGASVQVVENADWSGATGPPWTDNGNTNSTAWAMAPGTSTWITNYPVSTAGSYHITSDDGSAADLNALASNEVFSSTILTSPYIAAGSYGVTLTAAGISLSTGNLVSWRNNITVNVLPPLTPPPTRTDTPTFTASPTPTETFTNSPVFSATASPSPAPSATNTPVVGSGVLTYHNDNALSGLNASETILNPGDVNAAGFGKLFSLALDGQVYAQPLYVPHLNIPGQGVHNVVYVVTENDSVYAYDADTSGPPLWQRSFLSAGVAPFSVNDALGCPLISPEIGITGTPVIDPVTGTIYMVAATNENGTYFQRLHALDLATGAEKFNGPVAVQATVPGTGDGGTTVSFGPRNALERCSLVLSNGVVYSSYASHCDNGTYHGWIIGYNAQNLQQQKGVFNVTPNGSEGGLWNCGAGPAVDASGNLVCMVGNGTFDANTGGPDYGDSFLKLAPGGSALSVLDYFTPYNQSALASGDLDIGSGGCMLLPASAGSLAHPNLAVGCGKAGTIYLVDTGNMSHFNAGGDQVVESFAGGSAQYGTPAFFNNTIYIRLVGNNLKAYPISNAVMATAPSSQSAITYGYPGCTASISSNGNSNGIVWAIQAGAPGSLHAYNALNLGAELYNSTQNSARDQLGTTIKFNLPTVINGKVYVGTSNSLVAYGLFNPPSPTPSVTPPFGSPTRSPTFTIVQSPTITPTPSPTPTLNTAYASAAPCNGVAMDLDGVLNESVYGMTPFSNILSTDCNYGTGCGATDAGASAQFKAIWNSAGLWVGVVVSDPGTLYADDAAPWNGSGVEIFLDLNDTKSGYNAGTGDYDDPNAYQWCITYDSASVVEYHNATARTILPVSVATRGTGYSMEIEIPWANLGVTEPTAESVSGLDVAVDVANAGGTARDHQIAAYNASFNAFDQAPAEWGTIQYQACNSAKASTPSATPTAGRSATITVTRSMTHTTTPSVSPSVTPTVTASATRTATSTMTRTATPTATPSATPTVTASATRIAKPTATPSATPKATASGTKSATPSVTSSATASVTLSATRTATPSATRTRSPTATASATASVTTSATTTITASTTRTGSSTATASATASVTTSATTTITASTTRTESPTVTASATASVTTSATTTITASTTRTGSPTVTASATASVTPSATTTITASATRTGSPTVTASATPSGTPSATSALTASATRMAAPTLTFSATAAETPSATLTIAASPTRTSSPPARTPSPTLTRILTASPSKTASPQPDHTATAVPNPAGGQGGSQVLKAVPIPNPFVENHGNPQVAVELQGDATRFDIGVYTVAMVLVWQRAVSGNFYTGWNHVALTGLQVPPGIYFGSVAIGRSRAVFKLVVLP